MAAEMVGLDLIDVRLAAAGDSGGDGAGDVALDMSCGEEQQRHRHEARGSAREEALDGLFDVGFSKFEKCGLDRQRDQSLACRLCESQKLLDAGLAAGAMGGE